MRCLGRRGKTLADSFPRASSLESHSDPGIAQPPRWSGLEDEEDKNSHCVWGCFCFDFSMK